MLLSLKTLDLPSDLSATEMVDPNRQRPKAIFGVAEGIQLERKVAIFPGIMWLEESLEQLANICKDTFVH